MGMRRGALLVVTALAGALPSAVCGSATAGGPALVVRHLGELYALTPDGAKLVRLTTAPHPRLDGAAVSPDGRTVAFASGTGIATARLDGSHVHALTRGLDGSPAWSPDGRTIYFSRFRRTRFGDCGSIFAVARTGGQVRRVTDSSADGHSHVDAAVSPDGHVAFSDWDACEGGTSSPRLRIVDAAGTATDDLALLPHDGYYPDPEHSCPAWSPDGQQLAYRRNADLAVAARDGSGERRLVAGGWLIYEAPEWSADGRWIAFVRYIRSAEEVVVVHPDGTGLRQLRRSVRYASSAYALAGWLRAIPAS